MKKELFYYSALVCVIAGLWLSESNFLRNETETGSKVIDTYAFHKLDIDLACNFYVSIGDEQKVVFEGPKKYLDLLETNMEHGVLKISNKKSGFFKNIIDGVIADAASVNVYIKLTDSNQLVVPQKGKLITRETSLYQECENTAFTTLNQGFRGFLKLFNTQLGFVRLL
ncbi:MAG: hypothetical protein HC819_01910 [Cyclobacteriaceae bacterium]|nr:hypothetical protein [Cyclobacteriaceae bacterium]